MSQKLTSSFSDGERVSAKSKPYTSQSNGDGSFEHPPLELDQDAFRLLKVSPGSSLEPINCDLYSASIPEKDGRYIALSYTWGLSETGHHLSINGHRFPVRDNLYSFLKHFRATLREPTVLWIDAICIWECYPY